MPPRSPDDSPVDVELPTARRPRRRLTPEESHAWLDPLIEGRICDFQPVRLEDSAARADEEATGDAAVAVCRFRDALQSYMLAGAERKLAKLAQRLMLAGPGHVLQVRDAAFLVRDPGMLAWCADVLREDAREEYLMEQVIDIYEFLQLPRALDCLASRLDNNPRGRKAATHARQIAERIRRALVPPRAP